MKDFLAMHKLNVNCFTYIEGVLKQCVYSEPNFVAVKQQHVFCLQKNNERLHLPYYRLSFFNVFVKFTYFQTICERGKM